MTLRPLSGVDAAFLAAERPGNLLHMMGLLILDPHSIPGGYSFERFRAFLEERLPLLPPLRRRLVEVPGGLAPPYWLETEIDLDVHLHRAAVPRPGGPHEVAAMAAEMDERPLDRSRPLWEMRLVEGLAGGQLALLAKLHHATMDGMAGVKLMASLFSATPDGPEPLRTKPAPIESVPGRVELLARAVPWLLWQPLRAARAGYTTARSVLPREANEVSEPLPDPIQPARTWLNGPGSPYRSVAYKALPLAALRDIGKPVGATVNDVLLAVIAGALRRYLEERGVLPPEPLVAAVPLTVRTDEDDERSNAVTSVSVSLATDERDPGTRLRIIRDAMTAQKRRRGHTAGDRLMAWADVPPPFVFSLATRAYVDLGLGQRIDPLCNLVVSSVPGPPTSLYLGGARLLGIYPLGPIYSGMLLNITAIGCGDDLHFGIVGCRKRMPDLWCLADGIPSALDELVESHRGSDAAEGNS